MDDVVGSKSFISSEDASELTFIRQLIKETLRRYPQIVRLNRDVANDTMVGGYMIPANTELQVSINTNVESFNKTQLPSYPLQQIKSCYFG